MDTILQSPDPKISLQNFNFFFMKVLLEIFRNEIYTSISELHMAGIFNFPAFVSVSSPRLYRVFITDHSLPRDLSFLNLFSNVSMKIIAAQCL